LDRTWPKRSWADLAPTILLFSSGPDPAQKAGLGQNQPGPENKLAGPEPTWPREEKKHHAGPESNWPSNKTGGGKIIPPTLLHAERISFYMQEGTRPPKAKTKRGKKGYLARRRRCCWSDCFAGGVVVEAGGGGVADGRRLQAAALLFQAAERESSSSPLL